jgi:hypothetical protein
MLGAWLESNLLAHVFNIALKLGLCKPVKTPNFWRVAGW